MFQVSRISPWLRIGLAILVIAAVATVGYRLIYASNPWTLTYQLFSGLFRRQSMLQSSLRREAVAAPEIVGIKQWFNTPGGLPLTLAELRGQVVLVDFWTYSCINCIRTMPYITAWDRTYRNRGLVIIGVHTPEFAFEKDPANVAAKIKEYGIEYPVAMDNNYATWNAYANQFWPAKYFIDHEGNIVWRHFGEGAYVESEQKIQALLKDAGWLDQTMPTAAASPNVNFSRIGTPEIYLGYQRLLSRSQRPHFAQAELKPGVINRYAAAPTVEDNTFSLEGDWLMAAEYAQLTSAAGVMTIRYRADKANIVLQAEPLVTARVRLDGILLTGNGRGRDVGADGTAKISQPTLYNITDTGDADGWHTLELRFDQPGVQAFAFTFG